MTRPPIGLRPVETKSLISRKKTAFILGRSVSSVIRYHGKGLTPRHDINGAYLYDRDEVERLAVLLLTDERKSGRKSLTTNTRGDLARACFRHFILGTPLDTIVLHLAIEPEQVRAWHRDYLTGLGTDRPLSERERAKYEHDRQMLAFKKEKLELLKEKHLTQQRTRRDPILSRPDWEADE